MTQQKQPQDWERALDLAAKSVAGLESRGIYVPTLIRDRLQELQEEGKRAMAAVDDNLRVALAGKYSCGKSSFINSALGPDWEALAPVKLERTTRCATSFRYGEHRRITDTTGHVYTIEEYQEKVATGAPSSEFLEFTIELPVETLKGLVIVDTPGFDPPDEDLGEGVKSDAEISRDSVARADIVLFLMQMDDGTIQSDSMDYLKEITASGKPYYLILSQADKKKPAAKRIEIATSINEECKRNGLKPMDILLYCALREDKLPSSVRADALRWRDRLQTKLDGLTNFKQMLLGHRNQAMVDNYVEHVQAFLAKNLRFFKAMRQKCTDETNAGVTAQLSNIQQNIVKGTFLALCTMLDNLSAHHVVKWTERLAGIYRLRPDFVRKHLPTIPLSLVAKERLSAFLEDFPEAMRGEGERKILEAFANVVYAKTVEEMRTWSFDAASLDRLQQRFKLCVTNNLGPAEFAVFQDAVAKALSRLQTSTQGKQSKQSTDLNQWLDELIALAQ